MGSIQREEGAQLKQHLQKYITENTAQKKLIEALQLDAQDSERVLEENEQLKASIGEMTKLNQQLAQAKSGEDLDSVY